MDLSALQHVMHCLNLGEHRGKKKFSGSNPCQRESFFFFSVSFRVSFHVAVYSTSPFYASFLGFLLWFLGVFTLVANDSR